MHFHRNCHRFILSCAAVLWLGSSLASAAPLQVSVVLSENGGPYAEFYKVLQDKLTGSDAALNVQDTTQTLPPSSLVIAVGMKAANYAASSNSPSVLNVMIPISGHQSLIREYPGRGHAPLFSTIYLDQPIERQLSLIAAAFPNRKRVGLLYSSPVIDEVTQLRKKANEFGISLHEEEVKPGGMFDSLQKVLKSSDILLALPDPLIYNGSTLRNILISTYQTHIPLVGFSSAYVKAGAICAVFTTPSQFATQTANAILKFIEKGTLPPSQYPQFYEVSVNERVAQSLAINIDSADELSKRVTAIERRKQ